MTFTLRQIGDADLYLGDCAEILATFAKVDAMVTDPPYGIDVAKTGSFGGSAGKSGKGKIIHVKDYGKSEWDKAPPSKTLIDLIRSLSNYQIMFGGNYFELPPTKCWLVWDKLNSGNFADCELAWTNLDQAVRIIRYLWNGMAQQKKEERFHATQKPIDVMEWCISHLPDDVELICDPFMGSGTTGVAAIRRGKKFIGIERDEKYFEVACKRIEEMQDGFFAPTSFKKSKPIAIDSLLEEPEKKPTKKSPDVIKKSASTAQESPFVEGEPVKVKTAPGLKAGDIKRGLVITAGTIKPRTPVKKTIISAGTPAIISGVKKLALPDEPENDGKLMIFDDATWDEEKPTYVGCDVETFENFFLINFTRFRNGKKISFELSDRSKLNKERIRSIMMREGIVTFNGASYDIPMIFLALNDIGNHELQFMSNRIVQTRIMPWMMEKELGIKIPKINHIDLMEPNPSVRQGLKVLNGRLHGKRLMDLPYPIGATLTHPQMNVSTLYCFNDIEATKNLFLALREPLQLRAALTKEYKTDMRSKSDAQIGETIVKRRVEFVTGQRIQKNTEAQEVWFKYEIPSFLRFETPEINRIVEIIRETEFSIGYGKVEMPPSLSGLTINIGSSVYKMGIGGLHSTESHRAVHADEEYTLEDIDVASQYPRIIMKLGMYPRNLGPAFLDVYGKLIDERLTNKDLAKKLKDRLDAGETTNNIMLEQHAAQVKAEGGKIALNGVYGKLGSEYSDLYAPHMMIAVTLTGQLSILMLIEWLEKIGGSVVSANTDGVVVRYKKELKEELDLIITEWEESTGFNVERAPYKSIYNSSVNSYIAIKEDGKVKRKGPLANPWKENDLRGQLSKNPQMTICSDAIVEFITKGTAIEETIRNGKDIRDFVTVINVKGGGTWRGKYLAKVVRYYWSTDGDPILYSGANKKGNHNKVSKTDGAKPLMTLPDELPSDIDYDRYIKEATELAIDYAVIEDENQLKV